MPLLMIYLFFEIFSGRADVITNEQLLLMFLNHIVLYNPLTQGERG
jgi:hypothetical protein